MMKRLAISFGATVAGFLLIVGLGWLVTHAPALFLGAFCFGLVWFVLHISIWDRRWDL